MRKTAKNSHSIYVRVTRLKNGKPLTCLHSHALPLLGSVFQYNGDKVAIHPFDRQYDALVDFTLTLAPPRTSVII